MKHLIDKWRSLWTGRQRPQSEEVSFPEIFEHFQRLLAQHQRAMELVTALGEMSGGEYIFDRKYLNDSVTELQSLLLQMVKDLNLISSNKYKELYETLDRVFLPLLAELRGRLTLSDKMPFVTSLSEAPLDTPELTGGKANTLAEITQQLQIPVPNGFVVTTKAYHRFLELNQLEDRILGLLESWLAGDTDETITSRQIKFAVLAGLVPQNVGREILAKAEKSASWSFRSSAYGEDGELSFTGLHESFLQVTKDELKKAYKRVIASLFSPEALVYRKKMGLLGEEPAMAVLCQEMIDSRVSGVTHTLDFVEEGSDHMTVYACRGFGRSLVEGDSPHVRYVIDRAAPYQVITVDFATRLSQAKAGKAGDGESGSRMADGDPQSYLSESDIKTLSQWALALERYFKCPQEIEWTAGKDGRLWILQSRRLTIPWNRPSPKLELGRVCSCNPILLKDRGVVIHAGVGSGPVFVVQHDEDHGDFPEGAIIVSRFASPSLAGLLPKASAIVTEMGSAASHLATIAREFRVPALFDVENAASILPVGKEITLDTHQRVIYEGRAQELLDFELMESSVFEETPEFRLLRRILKRVSRLSLLDPESPQFTSQGCKSVHDMIRFIHEKAVHELMDIPRFTKKGKGVRVWNLKSNVPLNLKILDIGGGIDSEGDQKEVSEDRILSLPFKAMWKGLSGPGVWNTDPVPVDFGGMMSSMTKTFALSPSSTSLTGVNLAVIGAGYMNVHLALGYHFTLIDARIDPQPERNHVYFRFIGGVTDLVRRSRRAQLLSEILSRCNFKVNTKDDLVIGRMSGISQQEAERTLEIIGRLIGFTRQLDIRLRTDGDVPKFVEAFFHQGLSGDVLPQEGGIHG